MNKSRLKHPFATFSVVCGLALATGTAVAQASASQALPDLPSSAASAPSPASRAPAGPRLRSPSETGNRAAAPGDLRPERAVAPQISIPLGRKPPPAGDGAEPRVVRRAANPPAAGGIDDAAARCESQGDDRLRAACRAKAARESKGRPPN